MRAFLRLIVPEDFLLLSLLVLTVVGGTQILPIRLAPNAGHLAQMRLNVIHHACEWQPANTLGCKLGQLLVRVLRRDAHLSQAQYTQNGCDARKPALACCQLYV